MKNTGNFILIQGPRKRGNIFIFFNRLIQLNQNDILVEIWSVGNDEGIVRLHPLIPSFSELGWSMDQIDKEDLSVFSIIRAETGIHCQVHSVVGAFIKDTMSGGEYHVRCNECTATNSSIGRVDVHFVRKFGRFLGCFSI